MLLRCFSAAQAEEQRRSTEERAEKQRTTSGEIAEKQRSGQYTGAQRVSSRSGAQADTQQRSSERAPISYQSLPIPINSYRWSSCPGGSPMFAARIRNHR
ncbi:hypothetical protein [Parapedobacter koreensis]|uniref:hypothetical protein n=1 Tax=Parapedobacter koreensis TaxID=332977 RepID=UPI00115FBDEE|nr:hypothetical protein [Parapedobacter koreensis]